MKIISGAQTGADQGGLEAAADCGIETGGHIPAGCRTENGNEPKLARLYNLKEARDSGYRQRTILNVTNSDGTLWIGNPNSPGGRLTLNTCVRQDKPKLLIPYLQGYADAGNVLIRFSDEIADWLGEKKIETLNVAGNRESSAPGIQLFARRLLTQAIT